jgi:hypothetical protein
MNSRVENKVKLLFAGKVLSEDSTLEESNVKDNYWMHAIIKKTDQNVQQNSNVVDDNQSTMKNSIFYKFVNLLSTKFKCASFGWIYV